jgi:predicted site-specific integrase-resolvase
MTEYYKKYTKYLELKSNDIDIVGGGKDNKFILVDGTSSAGKSIICKYFSKKNFLCFQIDNYFNDKRIKFDIKNIKNKYDEIDKIYVNEPIKYMVNDAVKTNKNILFDHISQKEIINYMNKIKYDNLYIIIVFTNLNNLARNLEIRRKNGDIRGVFAFKQFSERYIKCKNNDLQKIEIINRDTVEENDLMKDMIAIITSFCCRLYGLRRGKTKSKKIEQHIKAIDDIKEI